MKDTSWNKVSKWYDQHIGDKGSDFHQNLILPSLIPLLNLKNKEKVLDLGCGQGVLCREMQSKGAEVTGIDASANLIKNAKTRSKEINFQIADATNLHNFKPESFDLVTSLLAIQNMDPLEKIVSESARVLKPKGRLVFVLNHPCFRIPRQSGWGFDENRKLQYRRVDHYMTPIEIPIQMHPGSKPDVLTWTYHRPLTDYFKTLTRNGFLVNIFEEWVSHRQNNPGKNQKAENISRLEIPMFLCLGAIKN